MAVERVGIHWNSTKSTGLEVALRLMGMLDARHVGISVNDELAAKLDRSDVVVNDFSGCGLLIVLGGDGTILTALDHAIPNDLPILGVNLGRLGFLSEYRPEEVLEALRKQDWTVEDRILLEKPMTG